MTNTGPVGVQDESLSTDPWTTARHGVRLKRGIKTGSEVVGGLEATTVKDVKDTGHLPR